MFFKIYAVLSVSLLACMPFIGMAADRSACVTTITDADGDGFGFENGATCAVVRGITVGAGTTRPVCSHLAVDNGDGWGWENGASCVLRPNSPPRVSDSSSDAQIINARPICRRGAVDHGSGWGWQDGVSCLWPGALASQTTPVIPPLCADGAFDNGGGWGWQNGQSCLFEANDPVEGTEAILAADETPVPEAQVTAPAVQVSYINGVRECSANAFDNGDGWGFEYAQTCRWGAIAPAGGGVDSGGAAPPPVAAAHFGFEAGKPICLTDSSDGDNDGYGFEDDRTCRVVRGVTATPREPLIGIRWCQPWAEIGYGDYALQNNTWNASEVYTDDWSQCIELGGSQASPVAKWDYNWLARDEGNEFSVKSYPQVFYGRKTSNSQSGSPAQLGLPAHIDELPQFRVRYKYSETGSAERNVALESFFHTSCEAENWNKYFELMVWVNSPVTKTPGTPVTEITLDGKEWLVYVNPALSWGYVAFVEKTPSYEGWLDWNAFVNWTRYEGPAHGIWSIGDNTCMGAIEIGTETFWGSGTFTLHEFRVER